MIARPTMTVSDDDFAQDPDVGSTSDDLASPPEGRRGLLAKPFQPIGELQPAVAPSATLLSKEDVRSDIAAILWSMKLHGVRRYFHQRHWERETAEAEYAAKIEEGPRLETVSEHSWHLADFLLLVAPHFAGIQTHRCVEMAILHDKLELLMGDMSPIGRDGTGLKAHAFNPSARARKDEIELEVLDRYLAKLRPSLRDHQREIFDDLHQCQSNEARLLKAVDKIQTLAFVHWKKDGQLTDSHLRFTIRYASRSLAYFPDIHQHYSVMLRVFLTRVAKHRKVTLDEIYRDFVYESQPSLFG